MMILVKVYNSAFGDQPVTVNLDMPSSPRVGEVFVFRHLEGYDKDAGPWHFCVSGVEYFVGDDGGYLTVATCWPH